MGLNGDIGVAACRGASVMDSFGISLHKSFRLHHIDLTVHFPIEVGMRDI